MKIIRRFYIKVLSLHDENLPSLFTKIKSAGCFLWYYRFTFSSSELYDKYMTRKDVECLFKTYYTQMYHLALTLLFDEAESKDVVSEVFTTLLSSSTVMKADHARAFLLTSVRHRCLNVLQHKQVKERFARLLTGDSDKLVCNDAVDEQIQMEELMRYLQDSLPPMSLEIFRLRYLQEMTCQEVAESLHISRQTVHTHLKQTLERIKAYFNSNSKAI